MALDTSNIPSLRLHQTLRSPAPLTRTWSSQPHPDPRTPLLATASSDKSVHVWDMRDWRLISTINGGHKRSVRCVGWKDYGSHDRSKKARKTTTTDDDNDEAANAEETVARRDPVILATGSFDADCGLWVWNRDYGRKNPDDRLAQAQSIPGSFDDDIEQDFTAAGAGEEEEDEEWHFSTLLTGPDSEIKDLQFSPPHYGTNLLATCSRDKSVWVWEEVEPEEWETIAVLGEHTGDVKCVRWLGGVTTSRKDLKRRLDRRRQKKIQTSNENGAGQDDVSMGDGRDESRNNDDEEEIILAHRELLATSSYDDTIRLHHDDESEGDWMCIAVITGHDGTVWDLKFEPFINLSAYPIETTEEEVVIDWAPRLLSCSDDQSIRLWKKELNENEKERKRTALEAARQGRVQQNGQDGPMRQTGFASSRLPSSIRVNSSTEKWVEEARLPVVHVRSIYAVDWSAKTGLIVSCGGDGILAVYQEVPAATADADVVMNGTNEQSETHENPEETGEISKVKTEWKVVAVIEGAHEEYEINHVCWAPKRDARTKDGEQEQSLDEEYIVSTGDDGDVRVWQLPEAVLRSALDI